MPSISDLEHQRIDLLTVGQARELVRNVVTEAIAAQSSTPELVDRAALARALSVSESTIDRLRKQGLPTVMVLDAPRFRVARVVEWLESRGAGLRLVEGSK